MHAAVVIPVKDFAKAKRRLAGSLPPEERAALAERMATVVARAAAPLQAVVVCDSEAVRGWAERVGARVIWTPGLGLNGAVEAGVETLRREGVARAVVAHGDLPLAHSLAWLGSPTTQGVVLVPDRHGTGTNVLSVPTDAGFRFSYGPGSFTSHRAEARRLGHLVRVVQDERLGWDVDLPADLAVPGTW